MNADDRDHVLRLIKSEYPDQEPVLLIVRWIHELGKEGKLGADLEDYQLDLIGRLLVGNGDFDSVLIDLKAKYSDEQIGRQEATIREAYYKLTRLPLFQRLFASD
jgi:hypothetical protein